MQRFLGKYDQRAAKRQIVALDETDRAERGDKKQMVGGERYVVEFPPKYATGGFPGYGHAVLPD